MLLISSAVSESRRSSALSLTIAAYSSTFAAVGVGSIEYIHKSLLDFRNAGHSVLLISSELSEIMSLSDRVGVMYKGNIIGEVDPKTTSTADIGLLMAGVAIGF